MRIRAFCDMYASHRFMLLHSLYRCMEQEIDSTIMPEYTSIRVTEDLADELHDRKDRGDSYEDVIWRLIERADGADAGGDDGDG